MGLLSSMFVLNNYKTTQKNQQNFKSWPWNNCKIRYIQANDLIKITPPRPIFMLPFATYNSKYHMILSHYNKSMQPVKLYLIEIKNKKNKKTDYTLKAELGMKKKSYQYQEKRWKTKTFSKLK